MMIETPKRSRTRGGSLFVALTLTGLAGAALGACTKDEGIQAEHDGAVAPTADATADTAPPDVAADVSPADLGCPSGLPGAALVRIETQGNVYCMDQREVNWGEYKAFMTAKGGDTSGQPTECDWNTSFEPEYFPVDSGVEVDPTHKCPMDAAPTSDDVAANCLDFCDALSYCESVGKRLCGRIGGPKKWGRMNVGGNSSAEKNAIAKLAATSEMEFGHACTQGSKSTYPYGDAYEPGRCLDAEWVSQKGKDSLQITNLSNRTCHGAQSPFDQIYDLSGSVEEWQNLCFLSGAGPTGTGCLAIGAGFMQTDPADFACAGSLRFRSSKEKGPAVGVRCCADAVPI